MRTLSLPFDVSKLSFNNLKNLITLDYGGVYPGLYTKERPHRGIDFGLKFGDHVLASHDGIVHFAGIDKTGYGLLVVIKFNDGEDGTFYAHLSDIFVKSGDKVNVGQHIGNVGSTGNSTGPHLHFEYRTNIKDYKTHSKPNINLESKTSTKSNNISELKKGKAKITCEIAFYRDDSLNNRIGKLFKNDLVTLTGESKKKDTLTFYEATIEYKVWIAEADSDGTKILEQLE